MSAQGVCAHCGEPIPPRTDPRGRKARYCSDACRAAAGRKRREEKHRAELIEAREQTALALKTADEEAADAARVLREIAALARAGRGRPIAEKHADLLAAARAFCATADAQTAHSGASQATGARPNRAQRRRARRTMKR